MKIPIAHGRVRRPLDAWIVRAYRENQWREWVREALANPDRLKGDPL